MSRSSVIDGLGPKLLLLWAGLAAGVAFVATPAKFLAPSLSQPAVERSSLHAVYVAAACLKILALLVAGLREPRARDARLAGRRAFVQFG